MMAQSNVRHAATVTDLRETAENRQREHADELARNHAHVAQLSNDLVAARQRVLELEAAAFENANVAA
jgi:hypothetical protein